MAECLKPTLPHTKVTKDKTKVPNLETVTNTLTKKFPGQSLPDTSTCKKIGDVFAQLSAVHKAYSEAAEGLAELSTLVMPEQFTMLLTATTTPAIQLIMPAQLMSPLSTLPPTAAISKHCQRSLRNNELYKTPLSTQPRFRSTVEL